jgi:NADPH:quinone reductase-like Zn-dependent oxidoreductase
MGTMDEFRSVVALMRSGALKATVDEVAAPTDPQAAYARLEAGEQFGKIVFRW